MALSGDGKLAVSGTPEDLVFWDVNVGRPITKIHKYELESVSVTQYGHFVSICIERFISMHSCTVSTSFLGRLTPKEDWPSFTILKTT